MFERMFSREMEEGRQRHGGHGHGPHCGDKHFRGRHGEGEREFGGRGFGVPVFGGREWGGRFRGRFFDTGDLRFVILRLIAEKPSYGYEIIKQIEERLGGAYAPSPGVVYPTLTLLEELGYVTVTVGDGTKKLHTITSEGQAALEEIRPQSMPSSSGWSGPELLLAKAARRRSCGQSRTSAWRCISGRRTDR